jgi:hypothetical protein
MLNIANAKIFIIIAMTDEFVGVDAIMAELKTSNPFHVDYWPDEFFVGREKQLIQLNEMLDSLASGTPSNLYIEGEGGSGKTTYLNKIVEVTQKRNLLACKCILDPKKEEAENKDKIDIDTIIKAVLRELEKRTHQHGIEDDWISKEESTFRTPRNKWIGSDDLGLDFKRIYGMLNDAGIKSCVICIDEGQRIDPLALSALKNSLQSVKLGYMIVISLLTEDDNNKRTGKEILKDKANGSKDPGASRFFENESVIGPFDTQLEAEDCIRKRLENNKIKFSQSAISLIANIMGRHPREMVKLAKKVYEISNNSGLNYADEKIVFDAFRKKKEILIREAIELKGRSSSTENNIYLEFAKLNTNTTAIDFTKKMYPQLDSKLIADLSIQIQSYLDKLTKTRFCKRTDKGDYYIPQSCYAYALRLILGGA